MFGSLQDIGIFLGRMGFDSKLTQSAYNFLQKWLKLVDKIGFVARIPCITGKLGKSMPFDAAFYLVIFSERYVSHNPSNSSESWFAWSRLWCLDVASLNTVWYMPSSLQYQMYHCRRKSTKDVLYTVFFLCFFCKCGVAENRTCSWLQPAPLSPP